MSDAKYFIIRIDNFDHWIAPSNVLGIMHDFESMLRNEYVFNDDVQILFVDDLFSKEIENWENEGGSI